MFLRFSSAPRLTSAKYFLCVAAIGWADGKLIPSAAYGQSVWNGVGSTTATDNYLLASNWSAFPAGAPPIGSGQSAEFGTATAGMVSIAAPISPASWTFTTSARPYSFSGSTVTFGSGSGLTNNSSSTVNIFNAISGIGRVTQNGTGTLVLAGNNSYTGGTYIAAGTVQIGSSAAAAPATISGYIGAGGTLNFANANLAGVSIGVYSAGAPDPGRFGTVNFYNSTSAAASYITDIKMAPALILQGADLKLNFFDSSSAGSANINAYGTGSIIIFADRSSADHSNISFGTRVGYPATRIVLFQDDSSAGYSVISNNGAGGIIFRDRSTGGNSQIFNTNFGTPNSGFLDISGLSSLGTTFGSVAGSGDVFLGSKRATVGSNGLPATISGTISDGGLAGGIGGSLAKTGSGTLSLTGVNTYTGATLVEAGNLSVDGSISSSVLTTVSRDGTLGGTGTVGSVLVDGGRLSPGNSIGTLTVAGNLVFNAGSSYMVEVSPSNADRVNVTGTAVLGGATVNASFATGSYITKQYTIVNAAGGVIGTFGTQVNTNLPSSFTSHLTYDSANAYLNLKLDYTPPVSPPVNPPVTPPVSQPTTPIPIPPAFDPLNANQRQVANTLVNYFNTTGGIPLVFGALDAAGLSRVAGETATGSQQTTFDAMNMFLGVMTDPFSAERGDAGQGVFVDAALGYASTRRPESEPAAIFRKAPLPASFTPSWRAWAAGFGGSQSTDGSALSGSNQATSRIYGSTVGLDYRLGPRSVVGFALAGGGTSFSVANGGSGRSDLFQAGAFLRHTDGAAYFTAAAAYGWQDITSDRVIGGIALQGRFNANAYSGRVEAGNRFIAPGLMSVGVTPYAAAQVTAFDLPAYAESPNGGIGVFALGYAARTVTETRSELGLRSDKSFAVEDAMLTLRGRAAWVHDYNVDRNVTATFQTLPGASFVVNGASPARDAALTTAAAELGFRNGITLGASFEGAFSKVTRNYGGRGVVRYAW